MDKEIKEKVKPETKKVEATDTIVINGDAEKLNKDVAVEEVELTREEKIKAAEKEKLARWKPKTKIGKLVLEAKITNIDEILDKYKILEAEVVDYLLELKTEFLAIGQAKGKFGGGKRRVWKQTQKKTAEGNVPTFACMVVVGDEDGHVGLGYGKAKETLPAREKAIRNAKLNIIKIERSCASFDCLCNEKHTVPFDVEGKSGSSIVRLKPAPQGTGLVIGDECKKILKLAGIKDVFSKTFGQTRTTINLAKACVAALQKTRGNK
jgi:small subunit ribosomal protein S5